MNYSSWVGPLRGPENPLTGQLLTGLIPLGPFRSAKIPPHTQKNTFFLVDPLAGLAALGSLERCPNSHLAPKNDEFEFEYLFSAVFKKLRKRCRKRCRKCPGPYGESLFFLISKITPQAEVQPRKYFEVTSWAQGVSGPCQIWLGSI